MSVRKRSWITGKGEKRSAFIVDYVDGTGDRHIRTFAKEKDAKAYHASVTVDVAKGVHVADSKSITVAEAGEQWLKACLVGDAKLERATLRDYRRHLDMHIVPYLGREKLSKLTAPVVTAFRDRLLAGDPAPGETIGRKRSAITVKKVITALGSIIGDAQARGQVAQNAVRNLKRPKRNKATQRRGLEVGTDIPTLAEIKAIIGVEGRWRPLLMTAALTGLRASELRGLRWSDVDLAKAEIRVRQRADRFNDIGAPKSRAGERTVPLVHTLVKTLQVWSVACPPGPLDLCSRPAPAGLRTLATSSSADSGRRRLPPACAPSSRTPTARSCSTRRASPSGGRSTRGCTASGTSTPRGRSTRRPTAVVSSRRRSFRSGSAIVRSR